MKSIFSDLNSVVWTGSQWVVVGSAGVVLTSPDGSAWSQRRGGESRNLGSIVWTGTSLVTVGGGGTVLTSP